MVDRDVPLNEDWHVHSTFSDGLDTLASNVAAAESRGLTHLGCVDHVRRDTQYLPEYVTAIRAARGTTSVTLIAGIEAKLLDTSGTLDLPAVPAGIDLVYVADHQFPGEGGPVSPRVVRLGIESGELTGEQCLAQLVHATIAAMRAHAGPALVLAHLFSIVPKIGLEESSIDDAAIDMIARIAVDTGTIIEISERWKCPSVRVIGACRAAGVRVVASTDSHRARDIGVYDYVPGVLGA